MVKISKTICIIAALSCMIVAFHLGFELAVIKFDLWTYLWKGSIALAAAIAAGRCTSAILDKVLR